MKQPRRTVEERARELAPLLRQDPDHPSVWWCPSNTQQGIDYRLQILTDGDNRYITCTCAYGQNRPQAGQAGCSHAKAVLLRTA